MSRSGYDKRTRNTGRVVTTHVREGTNVSSAVSYSKAEEVTSYRTEIQGTAVSADSIDPYRSNMLYTAENRRDQQRAYQRELERAGLPGLPQYEVEGFEDTGHPFRKFEFSGQTSLRTHHAFNPSTSSSVVESGGPFVASGARLHSSVRSLMPFQFTGTTADARATFKVPAFPAGESPELLDKSRTAIRLLAPGRPSVSIVRAVAELLAAVPHLPGAVLTADNRTDTLVSGVGGESLNFLFGIVPTVDDAISIGTVLKDISAKLHQYRRDAGRIVRRKMTFPDVLVSEIFDSRQLSGVISNSNILLGTPGVASGPVYADAQGRIPGVTLRRTTGPVGTGYDQLFMRERRTTSFAGAFTYYIPQTPTFLGNHGKYVKELDRIIGLSLDPTTAWELIPFSWLVDWFLEVKSNLDLIEVSFDDNLVVNYGYGMQTWERTAIQKTEITNTHPDFGTRFVSTRLSAISKQRIRANPYGFLSTNDPTFSPYRWSIMAALGLTKLR